MIDIVLGGKSNALSIARALGNENITSYLLDTSTNPIAIKSKYINEGFYYNNNICNFINEMEKKFGSTLKILYPTSDYWLEFIIKNKEVLKHNGFLFFDNNAKLIDTLTDKLLFYQNFSNKFSIPNTVCHNGDIDKNYIIKPRKSFQKAKCIEKGFIQFKKKATPDGYFVKQAFVDVELEQHYSVSGISLRGRVEAAVVTRKRLEFPSPGGTATMISTVKDKKTCEQLANLAEDFLSATRYSGAFEIEILKAQEHLYLLEVNARFWLQHIMPLTRGVNFALIYRKMLLGQNVKTENSPYYCNYERNLIWFHEAAPLSFIRASFARKLSIMKSIFTQRNDMCMSYFSSDDMKPLIEFIKCYFLKK